MAGTFVAVITAHLDGSAAESSGLEGEVEDSDCEPDEAGGFGLDVEVEPDIAADQRTGEGNQQVVDEGASGALFAGDKEVLDDGEIHEDEADEGSEVQGFDRELVAAQQGGDEQGR